MILTPGTVLEFFREEGSLEALDDTGWNNAQMFLVETAVSHQIMQGSH